MNERTTANFCSFLKRDGVKSTASKNPCGPNAPNFSRRWRFAQASSGSDYIAANARRRIAIDEVFRQARQSQSEAGDAEGAVLIVLLHVTRVEAGFGDAPRNVVRTGVIQHLRIGTTAFDWSDKQAAVDARA